MVGGVPGEAGGGGSRMVGGGPGEAGGGGQAWWEGQAWSEAVRTDSTTVGQDQAKQAGHRGQSHDRPGGGGQGRASDPRVSTPPVAAQAPGERIDRRAVCRGRGSHA